ncbi:sensor domain-containing protein [Spirulina major]|uniref:sensor domain-containing protein n=1 Tax=Spirulina major TaxID=270636 RepID=UPI0009331618|nr:EAL domain-containing protein [Spirulina major]
MVGVSPELLGSSFCLVLGFVLGRWMRSRPANPLPPSPPHAPPPPESGLTPPRPLPISTTLDLTNDPELVQTLFEANPAFFLALTPDGKIAAMNTAMLVTLGYELDEVLGQDYIKLCVPPEEWDQAEDFLLQLSASLGLSLSVNQVLTQDGDTLTVEWQAKPILSRDRTTCEFFFMAGMDVTERERAEAELHLLHCITHSVSVAADFDQALREVLGMLCETTGWELGSVWVPHPSQTHLELSPVYYINSTLNPITQDHLTQFWHQSQGFTFAMGEGLPGQVWQTQTPRWVPNLAQQERSPLPRQDITNHWGIRASLFAPIIADHQVLAVLEFVMSKTGQEDPRFVELISSVAMQLGGVFQRKRAEAMSQAAEAKYRSIFENAVEGIFQIDTRGQYLSINPAMAHIYGYDSAATFLAVQSENSHPPYVQPERYQELLLQLQIHGEVKEFESQIYQQDGRVIWISENARRVVDNLAQDEQNLPQVYYEGCVVDITSRKRAEENLRYSATHDTLTGLWNRAYFLQQVNQAIQAAQSHEAQFAVLFLDLDGFKLVNDSLGHWLGDTLLVTIARLLQGCLRPTDTLARLGGDEFTILMTPLPTPEAAIALANKIITTLSQPMQIGGHTVFSGTSIGVVIDHTCYTQAEEILQNADIAMYRAKAQGKNQAVCFDPAMRQTIMRRQKLDTDLRSAIERSELCLYYQPIVDLQTYQLAGFEALVRWQHPEEGWLSPAEFIPLAEERGQIQALGAWVLKEACQQVQAWQEVFNLPLQISVNLSSRQLTWDLSDRVATILAETRLSPHHLKLEITETALMDDPETAIAILRQLKTQAIQLCIDDFGTGYCSLSYLDHFPLDVLKIDKSFVDDIHYPRNAEIVRAIIALAQGLNLSIIAEGIESEPQLHTLCTFCCPYGQGYFFSRPLNVQNTVALLHRVQQGFSFLPSSLRR